VALTVRDFAQPFSPRHTPVRPTGLGRCRPERILIGILNAGPSRPAFAKLVPRTKSRTLTDPTPYFLSYSRSILNAVFLAPTIYISLHLSFLPSYLILIHHCLIRSNCFLIALSDISGLACPKRRAGKQIAYKPTDYTKGSQPEGGFGLRRCWHCAQTKRLPETRHLWCTPGRLNHLLRSPRDPSGRNDLSVPQRS